jgi:hypothetical protein
LQPCIHWLWTGMTKRPLITFQEGIYLCGCKGKSEKIDIKWFLAHSSGNNSDLFINWLHSSLPWINAAIFCNEMCCQTFQQLQTNVYENKKLHYINIDNTLQWFKKATPAVGCCALCQLPVMSDLAQLGFLSCGS